MNEDSRLVPVTVARYIARILSGRTNCTLKTSTVCKWKVHWGLPTPNIQYVRLYFPYSLEKKVFSYFIN